VGIGFIELYQGNDLMAPRPSQETDGREEGPFFDEAKLACSKCHTVDGKSGKAGPDLFAIGDKFARPELTQQRFPTPEGLQDERMSRSV
jgi:hypothetical protein